MHKVQTRINLTKVALLLLFSFVDRADAELRDSQMFRPIQWEESMTSAKMLYLSWIRPIRPVTLAGAPDRNEFEKLNNIYGLQVSRLLNRQWNGRLGFFFSQTGSQRGDALWSFAGSDLQHSLIPSSWKEESVFTWVRPMGYFGLGFASRWENSQVRHTLIPKFRYDESEPAAYLGISSLVRVFGDVMVEMDVRYFQSARDSRHTFLSFGGSLILGRWARL